jgi:hypothetical protein
MRCVVMFSDRIICTMELPATIGAYNWFVVLLSPWWCYHRVKVVLVFPVIPLSAMGALCGQVSSFRVEAHTNSTSSMNIVRLALDAR